MAVQRPSRRSGCEVTGVRVVEGYGLSETSPVATGNRFDRDEFTGTIGLPMPGTDIVDPRRRRARRADSARSARSASVARR